MSTAAHDALTEFQWEPQPEAQRFVDELIGSFLSRCPAAATLARRMSDETATRFKDWVDTIILADDAAVRERLAAVGYTPEPAGGAPGRFAHHGGLFPAVVLDDDASLRVGIKVESVADFLATHNLGLDADDDASEGVLGEPGATLRLATAFRTDEAELFVVERRGTLDLAPGEPDADGAIAAMHHLERFRRRPRSWRDAAAGFAHLHRLIDDAVADIGADRACDAFFAGERDYWQRRNTAARVQRARQDALGLGWANHDHHTYRCSRDHFAAGITALEKLGLRCRERFYAGEQAGWGAQVLEQPVTRVVVFADVDMSAEEVTGDFAHEGFPAPREGLGTVGLWVALHGESMLDAGMHHLECMFDHHALVEQLASDAGIKTMDPFTTFPFLRQAFTEGERWAVEGWRIDGLLERGLITAEQAQTFKASGAIGSHLENLERNDGYKGFNQEGVSDIIARTDPRKLAGAGA